MKKVVEENMDSGFTDDLCGEIYNLSGTLFNLMEIDSRILGQNRKARILRMRQIVFDTLELYICDFLASDATLDEGEEIPDNKPLDDDDE